MRTFSEMKKQSINNGELQREFPPFQINDNLTGGYRLPCTNHSRARNNFYVVLNGFMPAYVCDLSVDEVREHYPDVTLGDFFPEGIQEWIMRLYQVGVNSTILRPQCSLCRDKTFCLIVIQVKMFCDVYHTENFTFGILLIQVLPNLHFVV